MNAYWFKPKTYDYGATPVTWQGWLITALMVLALLVVSLLLPLANSTKSGNWIAVLVVDFLIIVPLVILMRRKTDGEWRWRWGKGE